MSTEIYEGKDRKTDSHIYITRFWGGEKDKSCVQITVGGGFDAQYIQMTTDEFKKMCAAVEKEIK